MTVSFPFRPWVRSTSRRALLWGVAVVVLIGAVVFFLRSGERESWGRAFGVLLAYSLLFWVTLIKIWWTAGKPAIAIDGETLAYQPLQYFRPRRIRFDRVAWCGPRPGTESYRFVVEDTERDRERELFLNLAVVRDKHTLLEVLGERLERAGLERRGDGWERRADPA